MTLSRTVKAQYAMGEYMATGTTWIMFPIPVTNANGTSE